MAGLGNSSTGQWVKREYVACGCAGFFAIIEEDFE